VVFDVHIQRGVNNSPGKEALRYLKRRDSQMKASPIALQVPYFMTRLDKATRLFPSSLNVVHDTLLKLLTSPYFPSRTPVISLRFSSFPSSLF